MGIPMRFVAAVGGCFLPSLVRGMVVVVVVSRSCKSCGHA